MRTLCLWMLALGLVACGNPGGGDVWTNAAIRKAKERGTLRVAMEPEFKPFEYQQDGEVVGFDVDLARLLADAAGIELELVIVEWDGIIPTLKTGKADLIISGMTATPLRALEVNYSAPYFHTETAVLLATPKADDVAGVADLDRAGRRIVVRLGTTGEKIARERFPNAEIVPLKKEVDCSNEVALGRADAFVYDNLNIHAAQARHADTTRVLELSPPLSVEPYAIACPKGDPETVAWVNLVLHQARADGTLDAMRSKHGLPRARR